MGRPAFNLTIEPGKRDTSPEMLAMTGDAPATAPPPAPAGVSAPTITSTPRPAPPVGMLTDLDFPAIERTTLSNGIPVFFARRSAVPVVRVSVSFDAGMSADPKGALGTHALMLAAIDEGTTTRTATQIAEESERLGASISSGASLDRTSVSLYALVPNLGLSLGLLSDIVRNPAFAPAEVERVRGQQLARIKGGLSSPQGIANYMMPPLLFGAAHPYGNAGGGSGEAASVAKITRDAIMRFHRDWIRPDNAQIFVVGDTTLAALKPQLETAFSGWTRPTSPKPIKSATAPIPAPANKIYLIDRPGSVQSVILGGVVLDKTGKDDLVVLRQANDVLGGSFLSRLNSDLRETKGWSYGMYSVVNNNEGRTSFTLNAPVQADRTGDSVVAILTQMNDFLAAKGTTAAELDRTTNGSIRELPGAFETSDAVLGAMQRSIWLNRPDDYYEKLPARYRSMTTSDFDTAARGVLDPAKLTWVIVGDAASVKPQLAKTGLPVEMLAPPTDK